MNKKRLRALGFYKTWKYQENNCNTIGKIKTFVKLDKRVRFGIDFEHYCCRISR